MNEIYWGNSVQAYLWAFLLFLFLWLLLFVFKKFILDHLRKQAERTRTHLDDSLIAQISRIGFLEYFAISLYFASRLLSIQTSLDQWLIYLLIAVLTIRAILLLQSLTTFLIGRAMHAAGEDAAEISTIRNFSWLLNGLIWLIALMFVLSNLGVNITSVVAGLGIGGIAIALATQGILGDLFSSLMILLDRPFRVGDTITTGDVTGTVENIGIKTSRLRSVTGEEVVISNSDLTSSRIRNMKRMQERRVIQRIGVTYQTTSEQCKAIPEIVREIVSGVDMAQLDRVHFATFGDHALIFEIVYQVLSPEIMDHMETQQKINLAIMERFEKEGIHFAYPTQSLYIEERKIEERK